MVAKTYKRNQKLYKMKGCSKKTRRNYLGGNSGDNSDLAYPSNDVPSVPNPFLAYTGNGGAQNINASDKTIPNTGPPQLGWGFINTQSLQHGGCGCGISPFSGGKRRSVVNKRRHRTSNKKTSRRGKKGGCGPLCPAAAVLMLGGNAGIPYPDGLVGEPWTPSSETWPGVNGIPGDSNYYPQNTYNVDPQTAMIATGANPPFSVGGKRVRKINIKGKRHSKGRKEKQRGGSISNFLPQDLVNLGRQVSFGVGSTYNALTGYPAPVNPQPWKDQLPNTTNLATLKASTL